MATQITLGNFNTQGGKTVITGGQSQIDTKSLIDGLVAAKRIPATRLETSNKTIDSQTDAFNKLKTVLTKLQSASDTLRNPSGVANASKNVFEYRTVSLSSSLGATASNYVDVTVQPGTTAQTYNIKSITQLAQQTKQQSGDILIANSTTASAVTASGSPTAGLFQAGTVNIRAVDGTVGGIAITLNQGDSLQTVASKFNEVSSRTGIQASVLSVGAGTYKLVYTATKTGTTYGFNLGATAPAAGAGVESDPSGVLSQMSFTTTQPAQNAMFNIDDVNLVRESNAVSDVIDGVTFNLKQPTGVSAGVISASIIPDTTLVSNAITQFADAYNEFRLFVSNQQQVGDDGKPTDKAVLYTNETLRTLIDSASNEITRTVNGITGGNPSVLADVGITLDNFAGDDDNPATKNILTVDTDKLKSSLLSNFDGVRNVFEYNQTSDNVNFVNFKRSNKLDIPGFTLVIDTTANTYKATYNDPASGTTTVDLDATAISGGGVSLKGQTGTVFEGSEFVYATSGNATIQVSLSQGYADRFYNLVNSAINDTDGTITQEVTSLADTKKRNQDEITTIDDRLTKYRDSLVNQYASLEAALSKANQLLQLLDAQNSARNNQS